MDEIVAEIHFYSTNENFFVVPVSKHPDGMLLEIEPTEVIRRQFRSAERLSKALQSTAQISRKNMLHDIDRWDGEFIWNNNELFAVIRFYETQVDVFKKALRESPDPDEPPFWVTESRLSLPSDISFDELAKILIQWC